MDPHSECIAAPLWLDTEFFLAVLRDAHQETPDVHVTRVLVHPTVAKGDNLGSSLYRAVIHYNISGTASYTSHLIIKSLPSGEFFRRLLIKMGVFKRELHQYKFTLPAMHSLLNQVPEFRNSTFSARHFFTCRADTLVLEDLTPQGYIVADRHHQLDLQHCVAALRALAKFHALSMILSLKVPGCMATFKESFYIEDRREIIAQYMEPTLRSLSYVVEKWTGFQRFGKKLRTVASKAVDCIIDVVKATKGSITVLNHGDFWINNILFKYDESSSVVDVKFVDFQSSRYASPALDLHYFIYTSTQEDVRGPCLEQLLREYHASLGNTLGLLGYGDYLFSMDQLRQEMSDKAFYGLISACTDLPSVLAADRFQHAFQTLLLHFESIGVL